MKRGFTLLEVVVVVAIIAILSLIGVNSVNTFRQEAVMDSTVNEFIAVLKTAKNKSMAGEVPEGLPADDFSVEGLPKYSVEVSSVKVLSGTYYLAYTDSDGKWCRDPNEIWVNNLEKCQIPSVISSELSITDGVVDFSRISGNTTTNCFIVKKVSNKTCTCSTPSGKYKRIDISADGVIKITGT